MSLFPYLKLYNDTHIREITRKRSQETRAGEKVRTIKNFPEDLAGDPATFVLLGLPEDVGVRANYGRGGTQTAWKPALENILNLQSNGFFSGEELLVLGHIDFEDILKKSEQLKTKEKGDIEYLRKLVEFIDSRVFEIVRNIVSAGKIPIIIGGGHNNAYPNIKAANEGLKQSEKIKQKGINVINCDPHSDFRPLEGRHSGNGFSYAYEENILKKYAVLGLHESYNTQQVLNKFESDKEFLFYTTFEDMFIRERITYEESLNACIGFCKDNYCGVELDLDAITNVPSSAKTSSGLSPVQARRYVYQAAKQLKCCYFHIAEGAPVLAHIKADNKTGKLISYLVTDFIKGYREKEV
ncbi:MAG: arginase family hydrolase, arginase/agmainase/formiminoglutamate hydrolase [Bacteroidetes bacterium]|jgi:formiminoglutamase|nr:arginase family hydrolase, arginase/agmainase/formiminoglutamate hydrolase [Bacteroidota bacterium]